RAPGPPCGARAGAGARTPPQRPRSARAPASARIQNARTASHVEPTGQLSSRPDPLPPGDRFLRLLPLLASAHPRPRGFETGSGQIAVVARLRLAAFPNTLSIRG